MIGLNFFISPNETMPTGAYVLRQRVKWGDHRILLREIFKVYFMKYLWRERERENINEWICTVHTYKYILVLLHFNKSFKYFCGFFFKYSSSTCLSNRQEREKVGDFWCHEYIWIICPQKQIGCEGKACFHL